MVKPIDDSVIVYDGDRNRYAPSETTVDDLAGGSVGTDVAQQLMTVLATESRDASLLVVGDSTGNETTEWVYLVTQWLASEHPSWTVHYRAWNDATVSYTAAATVQTGTGSRTLTVYNASVSGFTTTSWQAARFAAAIATVTPDLCFVSLGHNEGASTPDVWFSRYVGLSEELSLQLASTPIILVAQNPVTANTNQQARREAYREIAMHRGYGFIDVCKAFEDSSTPLAGLLMPDGVHPNEAGSQLWFDTVVPHLKYEPKMTPHPIGVSTLGVRGSNLLLNSDFSAMSGALPDHWGGANVTAARDTTNYESYSFASRATGSGGTPTTVKFTGTGAGQATIQQFVPTNLVKGKWVTLALRIFVPVGQASSVGRAALVDSTGSLLSGADTQPQGRFRWSVSSRFIPLTASYCRAQLYVDSNAAGLGTCSVDRASMVIGKYPLAP